MLPELQCVPTALGVERPPYSQCPPIRLVPYARARAHTRAAPGPPPPQQVHQREGLIYMVLEFGDLDLARLLQVRAGRQTGGRAKRVA